MKSIKDDQFKEHQRERTHLSCRGSKSFGPAAGMTAGIFCLFLLFLLGGCSSGPFACQNGSSIFSRRDSGTKTVSNVRENEMRANTVGAGGSTGSPWAPTASEARANAARTSAVGTGLTTWSTQRPNGGVLFPKTLPGKGPMVVLEPKTTIAPVGTEIVLVGSYVGPNNEYLMTNEKLEWGLDGVGHFDTSNPTACYMSGFDLKKMSDRYFLTETTNKLWRIHRGTSTPQDDVSVLKGQSWTTVHSGQEGTSSVSLLAPNIDNWKFRTASAQIHWIDAAFLFPRSGVAKTQEPQLLSTSVLRKSDPAQGRAGWTVQYQVLSGPKAGFGEQFLPTIETATDALGQSNVYLRQGENVPGTNQVLVRIIRPASANSEQLVVAEKTISQSWIEGAFFTLKINGPLQIHIGQKSLFQIDVTNVSGAVQDAIVRTQIPPGTQFVSSTPTGTVSNGVVTWLLDGVPARKTVPIQFELIGTMATTVDFNAQADRRTGATNLDPGTIVTPGIVTPGQTTPSPIGTGGIPSASVPPSLPSPGGSPLPTPSPTPANISFNFIAPFPKTVNQGQRFDVTFGFSNPGNRQIPQIITSCRCGTGVFFLNGTKEMPGEVTFNPLPPDQQNKTFPLSFIARTTGLKTVVLTARDGAGNVLTEYTANIQVVSPPTPSPGQGITPPLAVPGGTPSPTTPDITFAIKSNPATSPFMTGNKVLFLFQITNKSNYTVSNLMLSCTPEQNRTVAPWKFGSSLPTGAKSVSSSGSYLLAIPDLPAGKTTEVSMTFIPEKVMTNGKLTAAILSDSGSKTVASQSLVYSIAAPRVQRPVGTASSSPENR